MVHEKEKWIILFLFFSILIGIQAQNTLVLNAKSGSQNLFVLSKPYKITFNNNKLKLNNKDGISDTFLLSNISNVKFSNTTTLVVTEISNNENNNLYIYPNPVIDKLHIRFKSTNMENEYIKIIDVQGKEIYQQNLTSKIGVNQINISLEYLQKGLYIFQFNNGDKFEITKFIKN